MRGRRDAGVGTGTGLRGGGMLAAMVLLASGCVGSELFAHHVEPGGKISVQVNGASALVTTALADVTPDPAVVNGFSPLVTFGLVADGDTTGGTARVDLKQEGSAIVIMLGTGRTQLEVHARGAGCVGNAGMVRLHVAGGDTLAGDFAATGVVSGGTAACQLAGTLDGIPIQR